MKSSYTLANSPLPREVLSSLASPLTPSKSPLYQRRLPEGRSGLFWIWIDRFPYAGTSATEAASTARDCPSWTALFPNELGTDFAAERAALVDLPDELGTACGAKPEAAALGASRVG